MPSLIHAESGLVIRTPVNPVWTGGNWEAGDTRYTDPTRTEYRLGAPEISVTRFKLMWKISELIAIDALIKADANAAMFMGLLNDPKTPSVDLSLQSVQQGIGYVLSKIYNNDPDELAARMSVILTGEIK